MNDNVKKWLCSGCRFTLGYVENESIMRIKRKDLYVEIHGGKIIVNCCRCGKRNELIDDKIVDLKGG